MTYSQKSKTENLKQDQTACYSWENYEMDGIRAKELAWYIQIAIRSDLAVSIERSVMTNNADEHFRGYPDLFAKRDDLENLIREVHIVDEPALANIGMSLYDFPTLSHFFVAAEKQKFVREMTVRELTNKAQLLHDLLNESGLFERLQSVDPTATDPFTIVANMTPSRVESEILQSNNDDSKLRFLVVDMKAPVSVLKAQFLAAIERSKKQKLCNFDDWSSYGILPYMDLTSWQRSTGGHVSQSVISQLLYRSQYTYKKIDETTKPYVDRLLDPRSPVRCDLQDEASEVFAKAVAFARGENVPAFHKEIATEAFQRWFPRTYPYNFADMKRAAMRFPDSARAIDQVLELIQNGEDLNASIPQRIRARDFDSGIHDTIEIFAASLASIRKDWTEKIAPSLHQKVVRDVNTAAIQIFGKVTDDVRSSAEIARSLGRSLSPERLIEVSQAVTCPLFLIQS